MYKILIADDEMIERMVLRKKLIDNFGDSCEITVAENGREVVDKFEQKGADLLILDIEMPGMNGLDAAKEIRKMGSDCNSIFLTAFNEFDYARQAISVHAKSGLRLVGLRFQRVYALSEWFKGLILCYPQVLKAFIIAKFHFARQKKCPKICICAIFVVTLHAIYANR